MSKRKGSSFDSFLEERGIKDEVYLRAKKSVLVDDLRGAMTLGKITTKALADRMATSRTEVYRLLDPDNTSITLATMAKATRALGLDFQINVVKARGKKLKAIHR